MEGDRSVPKRSRKTPLPRRNSKGKIENLKAVLSHLEQSWLQKLPLPSCCSPVHTSEYATKLGYDYEMDAVTACSAVCSWQFLHKSTSHLVFVDNIEGDHLATSRILQEVLLVHTLHLTSFISAYAAQTLTMTIYVPKAAV